MLDIEQQQHGPEKVGPLYSDETLTMTELEQYLRSYMGVSDEDMANLVSYFHPTFLEKGDYFLRAGRVCDKLSFHRSGLLRVYATHDEKDVTQ